MANLDDWLAKIYQADIKNQRAAAVMDFDNAIAGDTDLLAAAQHRLIELDALYLARGNACAYSMKYREYLREVLG